MDGQGSLACCSPGGRKWSDTTEQLSNNNDLAQRRGILMENFWERLSSQLKCCTDEEKTSFESNFRRI